MGIYTWRRERAEAPGSAVYICGTVRVAVERHREGGVCVCGGGRNNPSSKPLDKHSTTIDRHYKQELMTEVSIQKVYRSRVNSS